jgi:hypothetical protein
MGNRTTLKRMKVRSSSRTEKNIIQHTHTYRNISKSLKLYIELRIAVTKPRHGMLGVMVLLMFSGKLSGREMEISSIVY